MSARQARRGEAGRRSRRSNDSERGNPPASRAPSGAGEAQCRLTSPGWGRSLRSSPRPESRPLAKGSSRLWVCGWEAGRASLSSDAPLLLEPMVGQAQVLEIQRKLTKRAQDDQDRGLRTPHNLVRDSVTCRLRGFGSERTVGRARLACMAIPPTTSSTGWRCISSCPSFARSYAADASPPPPSQPTLNFSLPPHI